MITITQDGITISESSTLRWVVEVLDDGTIVVRWTESAAAEVRPDPPKPEPAPSTFNREDYLTTSEAAVDIGVSVKTIQNWRTWSGLPSITDPTDAKHKRVLIAKRDWEAFLDARRAADRTRKVLHEIHTRMRPGCAGCVYRTGFVCEKFADPRHAPVANDGDCVFLGVRPGDPPRPEARAGGCICVDAEVHDGRCVRCGARVERGAMNDE